MATNTYVALDKVTISGTSTNTVTFSSISQSYTDLILVIEGTSTGANIDFPIRFNGDTGANYSRTYLYGNGSSVSSGRASNDTSMGLPNLDTGRGVSISHIFNYANTTTFKTGLGRTSGAPSYGVSAIAGLWRNTAAITSLTVFAAGANFYGNGTTLSLYGIASQEAAAKATGGIITSDATYYYHTFLSSGTFTPKQSITADILTVGGGGGGGTSWNNTSARGGGGSTPVLNSGISLTATGYTATVGAGGNGSGDVPTSNATAGGSSTFNSTYTSSGGTAGTNQTGCTGGPGAGGSASGSTGGIGTATYSTWSAATGAGQLSGGSYYLGGGGGGGSRVWSICCLRYCAVTRR